MLTAIANGNHKELTVNAEKSPLSTKSLLKDTEKYISISYAAISAEAKQKFDAELQQVEIRQEKGTNKAAGLSYFGL